MPTALDTDTFQSLRRLISQRCGIVLPDGKSSSLQAKLADHVRALGLKDFNAYFRALSLEPTSSELWQEVFRRVTTNETYFFRNSAQIKAFSDHLLPDVVRRHKAKLFRRLKIWSAACSTGEEAYTLAMQTQDVLGADVADWQPQIVATDIDAAAIREAERGHYVGRALSSVPQIHLLKYFQKDAGGYTVKPELQAMITFKVLNFADQAAMAAQTNMDVVFCRNVLVYFDSEFRKRVVRHLYESLKPGGYLVIGHSESLRGIHDGFATVRCPGTVVYQRPEA
jgi:chemotaxis protein methyltransferase CheR